MRSHVIARVRLHIRIQATAPIPLLRDRDRSVRGGAAGTLLWPVTLKTILEASYRNEAGRPPPNLPLVRGRDFHRYRFQCYTPLDEREVVTVRATRPGHADRHAARRRTRQGRNGNNYRGPRGELSRRGGAVEGDGILRGSGAETGAVNGRADRGVERDAEQRHAAVGFAIEVTLPTASYTWVAALRDGLTTPVNRPFTS